MPQGPTLAKGYGLANGGYSVELLASVERIVPIAGRPG